jgi:hypothetical protein
MSGCSCRIYSVEQSGHGLEAKLQARMINSLTLPRLGQLKCVGLNGEYFVDIQQSPESLMRIMKYCENDQSVSSESSRPMIIELSPLQFVHLSHVA